MESSAFFGKKAKIVTGSACLAAEIAVFFLWFAAPGAAYWKKLPYSWHWFSVRGLSTEIAGVCADTFATYHLPVIFALTLIFTANAAGFISLRGIFRRFWNFLASPAALPVTRAQVICLCVFAAVVVLFAW
ncbi:MAG: hypothetical protein LBR07_04975, partial [Puniceicoccales bacterium]|nr:hypothetical protein [Puniceicoccales bacterium]